MGARARQGLGRVAVLAVFLAGPAAVLPQERGAFHVIVNGANPVASQTRLQVSRLLLKKVTRWDDGKPVEPVDLPEGAPVRERFSEAVHRRGTAAIKAYWQQQIFSGADVPPPELPSDAEVVAYVKAHAGGIGYVSASPSDGGVKVVKLLP